MDNCLFEIAEFPDTLGTVMVASRQGIEAGQHVLCEAPLTSINTSLPGDWASRYASYSGLPSKLWAQYFDFLMQPLETQRLILTLFSPTDGLTACRTRAAVVSFLASFSPRNACVGGTSARDIDAETVVKVSMIYHFNAVTDIARNTCADCVLSFETHEGLKMEAGSALLLQGCRLTHSCSPNCCWFWDASGMRVVMTLDRVEAGRVLTVDYLGETHLLSPRLVRRELLKSHYEFDCDCSLCATNQGVEDEGEGETGEMGEADRQRLLVARLERLLTGKRSWRHALELEKLADALILQATDSSLLEAEHCLADALVEFFLVRGQGEEYTARLRLKLALLSGGTSKSITQILCESES